MNIIRRNISILSDDNLEEPVFTDASSEEQKKKFLTDALIEGEKSGFVKDFDPKAHLEKLNSSFSI